MPTENCKNRNPLNLSGTAQESRFPIFLNPDLVQIDGKTPADYQRILKELAGLFQYYDRNNQRDGDWTAFFSELNFTNDNPHVALFNAFVELIGFAQEDLNALTAKHLEFYYRDVLQLAKKAETPDTAHILFKLANNVETYLIEEETLLKAGKDDDGKERVFRTVNDIAVNKASIAEVKSIHIEENAAGITSVYASHIANSSDGIGGDLNEENPKWAPFGSSQNTEGTMPMADLGFAIASDFLLLKEGTRKVYLTLNFAGSHGFSASDFDVADFSFLFSGEEDWIEAGMLSLAEHSEAGISSTDSTLKFGLIIPESEKPIVPYNEENLAEKYQVSTPLLKVLINQSATKNVYTKLITQALSSIDIAVKVEGVKDLILQSETGSIDPSKPFEPYASNPAVGSDFYIGSKEIFSKTLTKLDFVFDWQNLPEDGLGNMHGHYSGYGSGSLSKSNFQVAFKALKGRVWKDVFETDKTSYDLFTDNQTIPTVPTAVFSDFDKVNEVDEYEIDQQNGFVKMILEETVGGYGLDAFGHSQYQNLYVSNAIKLAQSPPTGALPNEPYTPKTKSLTINYDASHTIDLLTERTDDNLNGHLYHISPFGFSRELGTSAKLLAEYTFSKDTGDHNYEGGFFIGVENLKPPQNLNILFQVAEGSENPNELPPTIIWRYLKDDKWVNFKPAEILSDDSNGMINSGIIQLSIPKDITEDNNVLPADLHWISGVIETHSDAVCQLMDIHTQAAKAVFDNNDNNLSHLEESLPAETIGKLSSTDSSVRKVAQPYASFGGKLPEEEENYYRRVAERLRHKNRAISIWDYERLVLEEYPEIYKVKCLNHTRMTANYSEQAPGHVSMVVISNLRNQNAVNILQPTTSLSVLQSIQGFLEKIKDPFATIHVKNPYFEKIKVDFKVKFHANVDSGLHLGKINNDIKEFLSPWAYSEGADIIFEGVIYKSKIINFIEELDYVDYVSCFKMYHVGVSTDDLDEISATKSATILVSHETHVVVELTTDDCECADDNIQSTTITDGIGAMTVALDFEVGKP